MTKTVRQAKRANKVGEAHGRRPQAGTRRKRTPDSGILAAVHDGVAGLQRAGLVKPATMREFDALCLPPVVALAPAQIAALRRREKVSQPVFARYLNVSKSSVSQWEIGEKKPDGAALKLLDLVRRKGLDALV